MWRIVWSCESLRRGISAAVGGGFGRTKPLIRPFALGGGFEFSNRNNNDDNYSNCTSRAPLFVSNTFFFSSSSSSGDGDGDGVSSSNSKNKFDSKPGCVKDISLEEAKKLMRLVNVEELKRKLAIDGKEVIPYSELIDACESMGVARSPDEATAFARVLDEAGVVLLFRDKVYLHPDKVVDLVRRAVPLALTADDGPIRDELKMLLKKKEEIDVLAHKQVRRILYSGLVLSILQILLFFRLTFWEFSWDVMEPIAFFATTAGIIIGYAYFLLTARDPTYQDLMKRLFLSRQRKLIKKQNFDINRFKELQMKCTIPSDACASVKNRLGLELELEDAIHRD